MPQGLGRNLYAELTVAENLHFFGRLFGQPTRERKARIDDLLRATGLDPFPDRPAGKLSGGMGPKAAGGVQNVVVGSSAYHTGTGRLCVMVETHRSNDAASPPGADAISFELRPLADGLGVEVVDLQIADIDDAMSCSSRSV